MWRKAKYDITKEIKKKPREAERQGAPEFLVDIPSDPMPVGKRLQGEPDNAIISKPKSKDKQRMSEIKTRTAAKFNSSTRRNKYKSVKARKKDHDGHNDDDNDKPQEFSSKKRPPILKIFNTKDQRKNRRDPRFEATSGDFDSTIFQAKYGEILEEAKNKDKEELLGELRKEKDPERISKIQYLLKRIADQEKIEQNNKKQMEIMKKLKEEKRKQLQMPTKSQVFLKKREIKQAQLVEKFKELKASSKLSKYIEKKRKRNVARERNKMFPLES